MSYINVEEIKYRYSLEDLNNDLGNISSPTLLRTSVCKLEADIRAEHILNRLEICGGQLAVNPGIKTLWGDEIQRRRNKKESSQVSHCLTQNRKHAVPTESHNYFRSILIDKLKETPDTVNDSRMDQNISVYPMETPESEDALNASLVDAHSVTSQNSNISFIDDTSTPKDDGNILDNTVASEEEEMFYELLKELRANRDEEFDSVLSQIPMEKDSDDEMDLSLPLSTFNTPLKIDDNVGEDEWVDSYFDATIHIPQLDGVFDILESSEDDESPNDKTNGNQKKGNEISPDRKNTWKGTVPLKKKRSFGKIGN